METNDKLTDEEVQFFFTAALALFGPAYTGDDNFTNKRKYQYYRQEYWGNDPRVEFMDSAFTMGLKYLDDDHPLSFPSYVSFCTSQRESS